MKKILYLILNLLINIGIIYFIFNWDDFKIFNSLILSIIIIILCIKDFILAVLFYNEEQEYIKKEKRYKKIQKIFSNSKSEEILEKNEKLKIITYLEMYDIDYDEDFIEFIMKKENKE
jgi:uncharacterized protein YxeA